MRTDWPVIAGALSTGVFVLATLPMLIKAAKTKDLASYSVGNLLLSNVGNVVYSFYVFSLPPGPAWGLHAFNVIVGLLMLTWWLRYRHRRQRVSAAEEISAEAIEMFHREALADVASVAR
jgi:uncharacterized protein with PQ loop repeat